jgi:plastocyanin
MHARRLVPLAAAVATAALAAPSALADSQAVTARISNVFAPPRVAVRPGESVTFTNEGGEHNMVWNDGAPPLPGPRSVPPEQWPAGGAVRRFDRAGKYRYYCELHGDRSADFGMVGYVYVNAAGAVPPTLSSLTAGATRTGVRVGFRASRGGTARATFFRRAGARYVRQWIATIPARQGANSRRLARAQAAGSYRVDVVLTDSDRLSSDRVTKTFRVR